MEKRQEVSSLKALSASLQSEVDAKKNSLLILEEMIKDVGKPKALEAPAEVLPETTVAKFFVAGPKGVCVEFSVSSSSAVRDVLRDAKCAFRSQRRGGRGDPTARLMYQGRWLLEDMTVKDCGIRSGDTLVYAEEKPEDDEPKTEEVMLIGDKARSGAVLSKGGAEDLVKTQSEAYRRIADELKTSFEAALKSLAQREKAEAPPSESLLRLDEKWTRVEISLRQQLDAQLAHYDTLLKEILFREKGRPIAGELENDVDDAVQLNALRSQLDDSLGTIKSLQNSVCALFSYTFDGEIHYMQSCRLCYLMVSWEPFEAA